MDYHTPKIQHNILLAILFILPSFIFASETISIESAVIFNTKCARCHEGECSGRMSFHLPEYAANQHILRHGGDLSAMSIRQLFKLLSYMKEECSYYPLPFVLINDRIWAEDMLNKFKSPSKQAYFMPIGHLEPGVYQLIFEELDNTQFCAEIISDEFDFMDEESLYGECGKKKVTFQVEECAEFFLRLSAHKPLNIIGLELLNLKNKLP